MGGHYETSFGVFMRAKPITATVQDIFYQCSNTKCANHGLGHKELVGNKYCSKCGGVIEEVYETKRDKVSLAEVLFDDDGEQVKLFKNLSSMEDNDVLESEIVYSKICSPSYDETGYHSMCKDGGKFVFNAQDEINLFKKKHSKEIEELTKRGYKLEIFWGAKQSYD